MKKPCFNWQTVSFQEPSCQGLDSGDLPSFTEKTSPWCKILKPRAGPKLLTHSEAPYGTLQAQAGESLSRQQVSSSALNNTSSTSCTMRGRKARVWGCAGRGGRAQSKRSGGLHYGTGQRVVSGT